MINDLHAYIVACKQKRVNVYFTVGVEGLMAYMNNDNASINRKWSWQEIELAQIDVIDLGINDMLNRVLTLTQPMVEGGIKSGPPDYTVP